MQLPVEMASGFDEANKSQHVEADMNSYITS